MSDFTKENLDAQNDNFPDGMNIIPCYIDDLHEAQNKKFPRMYFSLKNQDYDVIINGSPAKLHIPCNTVLEIPKRTEYKFREGGDILNRTVRFSNVDSSVTITGFVLQKNTEYSVGDKKFITKEDTSFIFADTVRLYFPKDQAIGKLFDTSNYREIQYNRSNFYSFSI